MARPASQALGVAAHETGHALQDQQHYAPLRLRSSLVPAVQFGSWLGPIIFMVGLFMSSTIGTSIAWLRDHFWHFGGLCTGDLASRV